ncbi:Ubiquinone biosynthesis O-methyltransferase [Sulfitobacter sp. DSM 110093]|uniref:class I SAM-dependent methyltransferase n=1 Tax=Sulfitobacter sp. DSM 110093 TaxID=2883127 RepID=UPI001FAC69C6|nr:class I SAM-dependent methyltransferase [Sulfitobacter sp. DSM 110093]UOA32624.1 Ubiquinone biosynthesis O-methyltransferase [Sulfitobacter sp. DSM 110093]
MTANALLQSDCLRGCPACDCAEAKPLPHYAPAPWLIGTCENCGLTYLRNPPAYEALQEEFAWEKTYVAKKTASRGSTAFSPYARKLRQKLRMYRDKTNSFRHWFNDGHVLDIGCGGGRRVTPPMTPYGIELSNELHRIADQNMQAAGGYCLHGAGAQTIWKFPEQQFDGILMFSYLEHETDVMSVLRGAFRALKDSGRLFIRVPNFGSLNRRMIGAKWCGFRHPDHVNYFTLATLRDTVARAGFTAQLVNTVTLPVDDNISVLLRKEGI